MHDGLGGRCRAIGRRAVWPTAWALLALAVSGRCAAEPPAEAVAGPDSEAGGSALRAARLESLALGPKPVRPPCPLLEADPAFKPPEGASVAVFADDAVPRQWLYACPVERGRGQKVADALRSGAADAAKDALKDFRPLPPDLLVPDTWPDFTDAINLRAAGGGRPGVRSAWCAVVRCDAPRLVRVCHGAAGMNVSASMWVSGRPVGHGEVVRLGAGLHPVVLEADHGRRGTYLGWEIAWLAPRFTVVTDEEIDDVHRWELAEWQATLDGALADEDALLGQVRFDPKTVRGREGFFRVGRSVNGRWWFIAPDGRAFYHKGCVGLNAGGMGGRRARLPPVPEETVLGWIGLLRDWGFTAMGSWTTPEFFGRGFPYADIIEGFYVGPYLQGERYGPGVVPDVWDARWAEAVDAKCRDICTPQRDSKDLIGYYLENERSFMEGEGLGERIVARSPMARYGGPLPEEGLVLDAEPRRVRGVGLLQYCLSLEESVPAAKRAWEFVLQRHRGRIEDAGKTWGVDLKGRAAVRQWTANEILLISDGFRADQHEFVKDYVRRYGRVMTGAIRRYDPNHLVLGLRHAGTPGPATLEAEAEFADVVSRNTYRAEVEYFDAMYRAQGRPILNGEISTWTDSFTYVRNPIEPPGGYGPAARQAVRARMCMDRLFAHPGVLGYTKYRWHGGGDKVWSGSGPRWSVVHALARHNARAASVAVASDRPPPAVAAPLHGQIFVTLYAGAVSVRTLPPARAGDPPSLRLDPSPLYLGLVCRRGAWDRRVYGNGIRGEVLESGAEGGHVRLRLRIEQVAKQFLDSIPGRGEYVVHLAPGPVWIEGTFDGTFNDQKVSGRAAGFVFRPAPTVRL
jgi:hypothetical protein